MSRFAAAVTVLFMLHAGTGRGLAQTSAGAGATAETAPMMIMTSIKPVHALVSAVVGDLGRAELLIDGAASPHAYALKPSQARRLNEARAVVMVSDDLETFMIKTVAALPKKVRVIKLDQTPGMTRLSIREGGLFEKDDHDHGHDHGHAGRKQGRGTGKSGSDSMDAHVWLDPENGKTFVIHLASVLGELDPAHKAAFESNARAYAERLDQLAQALTDDLRPVAGKPFLVFHDAYQYFERRFGVTAIGSITLNPEVQPGAKRLQALRQKIEQGGAVCVFAEPQYEPKIIATLTDGTSVRRGSIDPTGAALAPGPGAYPELLRNMAADLKSCLGGTS